MTNKDQNKNYLEAIILELQNNSKRINSVELEQFSEKIVQAKHIFLAGAGRSGIAMQAFTNRLMHLGFSVSLVGEISSPHSQPGDLLIICSGSGETGSLKKFSGQSKSKWCKHCFSYHEKDSSIGQLADSVLVLPGITKDENQREEDTFSQPMGSSFEQLAFLTFDSLVLSLMDKTGESSETMFARHADFE
ncbi:SIS domain-containing protein [Enterococcus sp. 079]|nr:SIS domain-containing protein [Enterococcus sp. 079]